MEELTKTEMGALFSSCLGSLSPRLYWAICSDVDEARVCLYRVKSVKKRKSNTIYMDSRKMVLMNLFAGQE